MEQHVDILCITAHPDDVELCCGGTVAKHVHAGKSVGIVDLTAGELGTRGSATIRKEEANDAAAILGVAFRYQLGLPDGFFDLNQNTLKAVVQAIRKHRPRVLITNAMQDRHPDHGQGSALVCKAAFLAGLVKLDTGQEPWRPQVVLTAVQDRYIQPQVVVDISEHFDIKMEAIGKFASQFYDPNSNEPESPISSKEFLQVVEGRALEFGRLIGSRYGEGFCCDRPLGVANLNGLF